MAHQSILIFFVVTAAFSIAAHWFVRRYGWAVLISAAAVSIANIMHEAYLRDFQIRPADVAFWIPMTVFLPGIVFALPVAALVGVPFYIIRRRTHSNAA